MIALTDSQLKLKSNDMMLQMPESLLFQPIKNNHEHESP